MIENVLQILVRDYSVVNKDISMVMHFIFDKSDAKIYSGFGNIKVFAVIVCAWYYFTTLFYFKFSCLPIKSDTLVFMYFRTGGFSGVHSG
jgi:hypothetical protein